MKTTESKKKAIFLDGIKLAEKIKSELKEKIENSRSTPGLAAILIGDDPASELYIKLKEKAADSIGIQFHKYLCNKQCFPQISQKEILDTVEFLNNDDNIDAIIVQLPLPANFNSQEIIDAIDPDKDVDGFHAKNKKVVPPTVDAIIELLKSTKEDLANKKTLIIGKSQIFMGGIESHLKNFGIKSVTNNEEIPNDCDSYDIVIIAVGKPHILKKENVKKGAIVIDVGINKLKGKTVGDVHPSVEDVAGYLSPVPGGVGPLTVACLLRNTYLLAQK